MIHLQVYTFQIIASQNRMPHKPPLIMAMQRNFSAPSIKFATRAAALLTIILNLKDAFHKIFHAPAQLHPQESECARITHSYSTAAQSLDYIAMPHRSIWIKSQLPRRPVVQVLLQC